MEGGGQWSDDEVYAWFARSLAEQGAADEIEPGLVRVLIEPEENDRDRPGRQVDVIVTREQLRRVAWATENLFDDRDPDVMPPATDPVLAGLHLLALHVEEDLATLRPGERYLVFFGGRLRPSAASYLRFVALSPGPGQHSTRVVATW